MGAEGRLHLNTARLVRAFLFRGVILTTAVIVLCRSDYLHDNKEPGTPTQACRAQCYELFIRFHVLREGLALRGSQDIEFRGVLVPLSFGELETSIVFAPLAGEVVCCFLGCFVLLLKCHNEDKLAETMNVANVYVRLPYYRPLSRRAPTDRSLVLKIFRNTDCLLSIIIVA